MGLLCGGMPLAVAILMHSLVSFPSSAVLLSQFYGPFGSFTQRIRIKSESILFRAASGQKASAHASACNYVGAYCSVSVAERDARRRRRFMVRV